MSCEVMYTCDHCNTHCSGEQYASIGRWDESGIIALGKTVHGCSKEHLGIALAKMFGISINGEADELLNRKQRELTKLADANNFLIIERDNMHDRVAELEQRIAELTAPMTVDGKTPGQVFGEAFRNGFGKRVVPHLDSELVRTHGGELVRDYQREQELDWANAMEIGAIAVLRAFGQPSQTTTGAVEALRRVRQRIDSNPYPDVRSLRHIDDELAKLEAKPVQSPPDTSTESGLPDPVIAAITLPTKPTKPLRERLEDLASYWEKGATSSSMAEGYRQASKDCAKELREVINDPR